MIVCDRKKAIRYLGNLIGLKLTYALKSPGLDLFDMGFESENRNVYYALHFTSELKVIWRSEDKKTRKYDIETESDRFANEVKRMVGLTVRRVDLSAKNDFWIDLTECWLVVITCEDGEESWRLLEPRVDTMHLVGSDKQLVLEP